MAGLPRPAREFWCLSRDVLFIRSFLRSECHCLTGGWNWTRRWVCVLCISGVVACAQQGKPLIIDKTSVGSGHATVQGGDDARANHSRRTNSSSSYVVGRGDTLYRIAWQNGMTVEELASLNRLRRPYTIYPGQRLRLTSSGPQTRRRKGDSPREAARQPEVASQPIVWEWPVRDQPVREFGKGNKGLDFDLRTGAVIRAVANGEVVYAGAGLGGYESLAIIRHANGFLSAYSLNGPILHKEGDRIALGDKVADIAVSGRLMRFHFEIRKDGDPVSPRLLLD